MSVIISGSTGITLPDSGALSTSIGDAINITSGYVSGIQLGGTGAANKLDDYEEGSVTLTTSDAVSGGNTGITTTGYYTKIGNQVTLRGNFTNITTTGMTAANPLRIQGLPYASNTSTIGNFGTCKLDNVAFQGGRTYAWVKVGGSSDYVYIQQGGNNISDTSIDVSDINSGVSDFDFQITYTAA